MKKSAFAFGAAVLTVIAFASGCSTGSESSDGSTTSADATNPDDRIIVSVESKDFGGDITSFRHRGFDIAGVNLHKSEIDLIVDSAMAAQLQSEGYTFRQTKQALAKGHGTALSGYKQPADVETLIKGYASKHPDIAAAESIGKSGQGRDIWALKITKDASAAHDPSKPVILYNGAHHAREVMSVEVPLDTIDTLLNGYGTDAKVTHWVDSNEIYVMPMFNVDGSNQVFTNDNMWRKNTKGCAASGKCASGTGVDINRNYPYQWAGCQGSSTQKSADDYHGTAAGSEVETQAMMNFVGNIRPVFDISYHTYSEIVLWPYGCDGQHTPEQAVFADIGNKMAGLLPSDDSSSQKYTAGTPWETLYSTDGDDMSWMYHQYGVYAYAIEVNGNNEGFQPSFTTWRTKTVNKLRPAWELLLDRVDQSGIRGVVADVPANATVTVGSNSRPVNPDGSFHFITEPGTYTVTVSAPGHTSFTKSVTVAATRVDLAVTL